MTDAAARYRRIAALRLEIQSAAAKAVPRPILVHWAKHLGLWDGKGIVLPDEFSTTLLAELAVHVPWQRQAAGIFRYQPPEAEDAAERGRVLEALRDTRVAMLRIAGPDPRGGVLVEELGSAVPQWLMDEALARNVAPGVPLVARLAQPDEFLITTGAVVQVDPELLEAVKAMPAKVRADGRQDEGAFVANLYRAVLNDPRSRRAMPGTRH